MPDLSIFANSGETKTFPSGHWFFKAGDSGDLMYVVLSGDVDILINEKIVETVHPGGIFGEMALIDKHERSAGARARSDVEVAAIDQKHFIKLIGNHPYFAIEVMNVMADRLRLLNQALY